MLTYSSSNNNSTNNRRACVTCKAVKARYLYPHSADNSCTDCFSKHVDDIRIVVDAVLNKLIIRSIALCTVIFPEQEAIEDSAAQAHARIAIVDRFQSDIVDLQAFVMQLYCFFSSIDDEECTHEGTGEEIEAHNLSVKTLKDSFVGLGRLWSEELATLKNNADKLQVYLLKKILIDAGIA